MNRALAAFSRALDVALQREEIAVWSDFSGSGFSE